MKKTVFILSLILLLTGCTPSGQGGLRPSAPPEKEGADSVAEQMNHMTLTEKTGQLVMVGVDGYQMDDHARSMIEENKVGGVILLGKNIQNTEQVLDLINSLKNTNSKNRIPLFVSVDEEGGSISRMPSGFYKLPASREIGKLNREELCFQIGKLIADEIKAFGYNMDFAPVLDIDSNPENTVIGNRAFGSDAHLVSKMGISTMDGIKSGGVIAVVKHFPGHGGTSVDPHVGLPTVHYGIERLKSVELVPFRDAVNTGADAVMVAHILMDQLDAENPASMSKAVISELLRNQLGFDGVVITDDMTMGAVTKQYDIGRAAVKAICAGADIVLVCHGAGYRIAVTDAIQSAVKNGEISEERLNESVRRILSLKQKYDLKDETIHDLDPSEINRRIIELLKNNF